MPKQPFFYWDADERHKYFLRFFILQWFVEGNCVSLFWFTDISICVNFVMRIISVIQNRSLAIFCVNTYHIRYNQKWKFNCSLLCRWNVWIPNKMRYLIQVACRKEPLLRHYDFYATINNRLSPSFSFLSSHPIPHKRLSCYNGNRSFCIMTKLLHNTEEWWSLTTRLFNFLENSRLIP